jgi:hypothetical protein
VAQVMCSLYMGLIMQLQTEPDLDLMAYARVTRALFEGTFVGEGQMAGAAFVH